MSSDNLLAQRDDAKNFTDILSSQNPTVDTPHAVNAVDNLNGDVGEPVPDHLAMEMAQFNKTLGNEPDGLPPIKPETAFTRVRIL